MFALGRAGNNLVLEARMSPLTCRNVVNNYIARPGQVKHVFQATEMLAKDQREEDVPCSGLNVCQPDQILMWRKGKRREEEIREEKGI